MAEEVLLDYFRDDFSLLIEAGFVAVKQLDEIAARRLFKAAELLRPDHSAAQLGLGYIALNKLQVAEAAKIFERILKREPEHGLAQALLGVCYLLTKTKRKKGEALIQEVKAKSEDQTIKNLANVCIEWARDDLQLEDAPLSPITLAKTRRDEEEEDV